MDRIVLKLEPRAVMGKAVKRLRSEGMVPAVIHDHGKPSTHVMAAYLDIAKVYQAAGKHHPVDITAGDKQYTALIRQVDFDPRKHQLRHVVFNAVRADEEVDAEVPVHIRFDEGNDASPAERAGLIVLHQLEAVEVKARANNLPDFLEFDGEKLVEVGDSATVADLVVPTGVTIITDSNHPLATVFEPSAIAAANDELAGAEEPEPEVEEGTEEGAAEAEEGAEAKPAAEDKKE